MLTFRACSRNKENYPDADLSFGRQILPTLKSAIESELPFDVKLPDGEIRHFTKAEVRELNFQVRHNYEGEVFCFLEGEKY